MQTCFKCGTTKGKIVKHHISYNPEIIVDCCASCHKKIHYRIRRENRCSLTVSKVRQLSARSSSKRHTIFRFSNFMITDIKLVECLYYNPNTKTFNWISYFRAQRGKKLYYL